MSPARRERRRSGRRLVLVDIENVAGGSLRTLAKATWSRRVVETALEITPGEHVVIGVSSVAGLFHAQESWPHVRVVLRLGCDGADHALLDVVHGERVAERFERVSIVSGDGIFAEAASGLARSGVTVTAASWRECMSPRLRLAATHTVVLNERRPDEGCVA